MDGGSYITVLRGVLGGPWVFKVQCETASINFEWTYRCFICISYDVSCARILEMPYRRVSSLYALKLQVIKRSTDQLNSRIWVVEQISVLNKKHVVMRNICFFIATGS